MKLNLRASLTVAALASGGAASADAQDALIATCYGPSADCCRQVDSGVALHLKQERSKIAGRPVEIIKKDAALPWTSA